MTSLLLKLQKQKVIWDSLSTLRRRQLLGLQLLSLAAAAGEVANLGALLPFLRLLANPKEGLLAIGPWAEPLRALPDEYLLVTLGLSFLIVVVLTTSLRLLTIRCSFQLTALIAIDLSEKVFSAVLYRPFPWHIENNSSKVLGNITKDVDRVTRIIKCFLDIIVNLSVVILLGASLIALAPGVMVVVASILASFYLIIFRITKKDLRSDGLKLTNNYQKSVQMAQEGLGGIRDVLLDRSQLFFTNNYLLAARRYRLSQASAGFKIEAPRYIIEGFVIVLIIGLSLTLALGGRSIEQLLPLLGTLVLGAYRLLQPLQRCFSSLGVIQSNQPSLQSLRPYLQQIINTDVPLGFSREKPFDSVDSKSPLIELKQLSFRYNLQSPYVLKDLNFSIHPGERIAFVGSTGSGKSTTSDLILGLLTPSEGRLLVHGKDLHSNSHLVSCWQQCLAHVPQNIYLTDTSFASNIAFGIPLDRIDFERVRLSAEKARIAEVIESSPDGYSTIVGEHGVKLSGGQRQRIGLARALYKKAELLVLDEATSALDNRTEAEVMSAIDGLDRKVTVILIAHRLTTIQRCDRILHLEQGQIAGFGAYEELLSTDAAFKNLAQIQS
ncbi:ABC transporter ATP-binding protein [Synechococcus sp. MIT S9510]|uniref:ABC transporter ATP-binding protein n=1 Tax=unclassified Synechococcus TaxID=2626047 RepID=UPI0039AF7ECA